MAPLDLSSRTAVMLPWLVATAFFMQMLDSTILNTALPAIAQSLNEDPMQMQAVVVAYLLTVAVLIPASGWMAERFGTKRIFLVAIILFCTGSLLCALSDSLIMLVVSRVVQGAGGSLLVPVGRLVIILAFPRSRMIQLLSFVSIPGMLGPLMGPVLGGLLVEYLSWHWIFIINLPIGVLGIVATLHFMPDLKRDNMGQFDWPGFVVFGAAMILVSLAMDGLSDLHLSNGLVMVLATGGLAFFVCYWFYAMRKENPLFQPQIFKTHSFAVGICGNLFARLSIGALPFLNPLMLQLALGYSPFNAGLMLAPPALASLLARPFSKKLIDLFGYRKLLVSSTVLSGLFMASLAFLGPGMPMGVLILLLSAIGGINAIQFIAMNTLTLIELPDAQSAQGNSLLSVVMQLAASLAVGTAAVLLGSFSEGSKAPEQVLFAFRATYICIGIISVLAAAIFLQLKTGEGSLQTSDHDVQHGAH